MVERPLQEPLSPQLALRLLPATGVGRVVGSRQALPHVWPVRFALVDGLVAFPAIADLTSPGRSGPTIVGFQVDDGTVTEPPGWSVMLVGPLQMLSPRVSLESLSVEHALGLFPEVVHGVRHVNES